jgi:hypothetical protein
MTNVTHSWCFRHRMSLTPYRRSTEGDILISVRQVTLVFSESYFRSDISYTFTHCICKIETCFRPTQVQLLVKTE